MFEDIPSGVDIDATVEINAIDETTTAFERKVTKLNELVGAKRETLTSERQSDFDRAGLIGTENGVRQIDKDRQKLDRDFIERGISEGVSAFREELTESSATEREAMLKNLNGKLERLNALADTFPNATGFLARLGLGSTEHSAFVTTLAGAGKAELSRVAKEAILSGNKLLASAVVTVNDRMAIRDRPFKSIELADRLVGEEHKTLLNKITESRTRVKAAIDLNRLFEAGQEHTHSKIERGLAARTATGA